MYLAWRPGGDVDISDIASTTQCMPTGLQGVSIVIFLYRYMQYKKCFSYFGITPSTAVNIVIVLDERSNIDQDYLGFSIS